MADETDDDGALYKENAKWRAPIRELEAQLTAVTEQRDAAYRREIERVANERLERPDEARAT